MRPAEPTSKGVNSTDIGDPCFLCGSSDLVETPYLRLNSRSVARNVAYALPQWAGKLLSALSARFAGAYRPVQVNRKYFDRQLAFCRDCSAGRVVPGFHESELAEYYRSFYWMNRDSVDGDHVPLESGPNDRQRSLAMDRIHWLQKWCPAYGSVIDYGAGDCAASYQFLEHGTARVHVVDPSERAQALARKYGAGYSPDLDGAPMVDLVYSAHSLEHVADLRRTLEVIAAKTVAGGHVFLETPNIEDEEVFLGLCHTPHTFLLSEASLRIAIQSLPFRMVAAETCGPEWRASHPGIASNARADLRVLLQKLDATQGRPS